MSHSIECEYKKKCRKKITILPWIPRKLPFLWKQKKRTRKNKNKYTQKWMIFYFISENSHCDSQDGYPE